MLRVTADIFSGRPNPSWLLDTTEAADILKELALHRSVLDNAEAGFDGLGFRALQFEFLSDYDADAYGLPHVFRLAHGASPLESKALEIADKVYAGMLRTAYVQAHGSSLPTPIDAALERMLRQQLVWAPRGRLLTAHQPVDAGAAAFDPTCWIELAEFNPGFWNTPYVMARNNCYNYACNHRTDTFAQPGRAAGQQYMAVTCPAVSQAARYDGLHDDGNCFPSSEAPRWFVALVVAPGPDFVDYHWYRKHLQEFWGHKPGWTEARNTDNRGHLVTDPRWADRGPYTDFCGFMYACRSQTIG